MGHASSRQRLSTIEENVDVITQKIRTGELSDNDRNRSHEILLDYVKELNLILSKSIRRSRMRKVERIIIAALQDLAILEGNLKNVEPRLKAKSLQTLHDIEKDIKNLNDTLINPNYEAEKEVVSKYKKRISLIENVDQEVDVKKNELLNVVSNVENVFSEMEYEERLKQVEQKHYQFKVELRRFVGVSDSRSYKKQKEHLLQLKEEVGEVAEISDRISARKNYLLFNIDNNLSALESKVRENEEKIRKQMLDDEVFVGEDQVLVEHVISCYNNFERSFPVNYQLSELEDICKKLTKLKAKIDQKIYVLENQIQMKNIDPCVELIPVRENHNKIPSPSRRVLNKIKEIQVAVLDVQEQISKSTYIKDSQLYLNFKKKLDDAKKELEGLTFNNEQEASFGNNVFSDIEKGLILLDNNVSHSRSTSGDILIDIMTISANVNELGRRIHSNGSPESYNAIETELLEYWYHLRKMDIPLGRSNVCQLRDYAVIQIESHLSNLERLKKSKSTSDGLEPKGVLHSDL